jgi:hypothetical protein
MYTVSQFKLQKNIPMKCVKNSGTLGSCMRGGMYIEKHRKRMRRNNEIPCMHYLVENSISCYHTHILSSVRTLILFVILPAKQK